MKFKMNTLEKKWVLYDVANSAFTLLVSTIMPIYFNGLADAAGISDVDYLAYWGYATSLVTIIVAILGPTLGAVSDLKGYKKRLFAAAVAVGCIGCVVMGFLQSWLWFLGVYVLSKTAYSTSLVFYDAMLPDVTQEDRVDEVSSYGYAWGYIGSCIPFVACLALVLLYEPLGISMGVAMAIAFAIIALWWFAGSLPLLKAYRQVHYVETVHSPLKDSFRRLAGIFGELGKRKDILLFLLAFFFYIDGVYTIIDMATAYGTALGLDTTGLLLALLFTQVVAFPCAILFGRLSRRISAKWILSVCIGAYFCIAVFAFFLDTLLEFWILAGCVGMFQGTIQAISRSYYTKIIPAERAGEYFGVYDICGKGAAFTGTLLISVVSQLTNSTNAGVGSLSVMFLIGFLFFRAAIRSREKMVESDQ